MPMCSCVRGMCACAWSIPRSLAYVLDRIVSICCPLFLGISWISFLGVCNLFFVAIFTAEAVLKLFSFGPTIYFAEAWNKFDCAVVRSA